MPEAAAGRLAFAAVTHAGCVRSRNEDCIAIGNWLQADPMAAPRAWEEPLDHPVACIVLDGMGGQAEGQLAARLAAQHLARGLPDCRDEDAITACIESANRLLYDQMRLNPGHRGMGATLAGMRVAPGGITVFNVGDSRVYRAQDGFLRQLSIDDVRRPGATGAAPPPRSNLVTQSLGGGAEFIAVTPHLSAQPVAAHDTYLLCSDGLYDALDIDAMESALDDDLAASAARLFDRAMQAGARDNVSLILLRVKP